MAEQLLRQFAKQRGLAIETASCGTAAESFYQVPEIVSKLLVAEGVPAFKHKPRLATRETLRWGDRIYAMTSVHHDYVVDHYSEFSSRTRLLREAAGFGDHDIEDPMGRSDEFFSKSLGAIRESLEALIKKNFK